MSIVPMRRITLCGPLGEKAGVLDGLQAMGVMHLIPLGAPPGLEPTDPAGQRRARTAYKHLMEAPEPVRPYRLGHAFDAAATVERIMDNRRSLRVLDDRRAELAARVAELQPWGEINYPPLAQIAGQRLWFYALPLKERRALDKLELPWTIVGRGPTTLHVVVVSPDEPPASVLPVRRTHTGAKPLSAVEAELEDTELELDKAQAERRALTRWRLLLGAAVAAADDQDALRDAALQTRDEDRVFAVQGWAPAERVDALQAFAVERGLALLIETPGAADKPPTLLQAPEGVAVGDDLINFYTSPGYRDWNPSVIVFFSFAVFFAMIMADAGYALVMAAATALYWKRMGSSSGGRRLRTLLGTLAAASLVFGVLAGSYFGLEARPGTLAGRLRLFDLNDFTTMMQLSVCIGAIHLTLAHVMVAWHGRGTARMLAPLGWIAAVWGFMLWWIGGAAWHAVAYVLLAGGLAVVFLGSAAAAASTSLFGRLVGGLLGVIGVSKHFGDLLSYLRLFALGLASASLAATFNGLAGSLQAAMPGLGVLLALLVLVFGHAITFLLGIMSGVVHGLRLNYIEFFGWSLSEEGYPFRSFAKKEISA